MNEWINISLKLSTVCLWLLQQKLTNYIFIMKCTHNHSFLQINIFKQTRQTIFLLLHVYVLPREHVYQPAAWQRWGGTHRLQGNFTSPLLLFYNKESRQKIICHTVWKHFPYWSKCLICSGQLCIMLTHFPQQ
jgi:hypothetical protein